MELSASINDDRGARPEGGGAAIDHRRGGMARKEGRWNVRLGAGTGLEIGPSESRGAGHAVVRADVGGGTPVDGVGIAVADVGTVAVVADVDGIGAELFAFTGAGVDGNTS